MEEKKKGYFWIVCGIIMGVLEVANGIHDLKVRYDENNKIEEE